MRPQFIQNLDTLATNDLRRDALSLAEVGYATLDTGAALERTVRKEGDALRIGATLYPLQGRRVFFVGIGKCAVAAARAVEGILGDALTAGIALDVAAGGDPLSKIEVCIGTHPLPSIENERATRRIALMLSGCTKDDLVLMLVSGGGSTLICLPTAPMTPADEAELFTELSSHGASIQEINTVRKHTSLARGGWLAASAHPAEVISLIISDVPGNDMSFVSSGPSVRDTTTIDDAHAVLARYGIEVKPSYTFTETPKDPQYFERVTNLLFLTNRDALLAMQDAAKQKGYAALVMNDQVAGEARDIGRDILKKLHSMPSKTVLFYAGESTVTFGNFREAGGRNQEMALAALSEVRPDELLLPFASDGRDNSDHAGGIADASTIEHAREKDVSIEEYLAHHRSYDFFAATGDALCIGYTESNVSDLIIAIKQ
jgi:glycerate-2-kinase